jgi:phage FluMu protein Com
MWIKCSECNVLFELDSTRETAFYTECPSCKALLNVEVKIKVEKRNQEK